MATCTLKNPTVMIGTIFFYRGKNNPGFFSSLESLSVKIIFNQKILVKIDKSSGCDLFICLAINKRISHVIDAKETRPSSPLSPFWINFNFRNNLLHLSLSIFVGLEVSQPQLHIKPINFYNESIKQTTINSRAKIIVFLPPFY